MGIPFRRIAEIGLGAAGVQIGNADLAKIEKEENRLLAAILVQQQVTNAVLIRILEDAIGDDETEKFLDGLG